jgi:hypothetical protein
MKNKKEQKAKNQHRNGNKAARITTPKTATPEVQKKRTIKQLVIETITANNAVTTAEMIAAVKAEFPKSAFKESHASWYRSQARRGSLTGSPIEVPAKSKKSKSDAK